MLMDMALSGNRMELMRQLLASGAAAADNAALEAAMMNDNDDIAIAQMELLIEHGADLSTVSTSTRCSKRRMRWMLQHGLLPASIGPYS